MILIYIYVSRNVALPFRWKLYKPFFKCPVAPGVPVRPPMTSSHVPRTLDDHGVFMITPNMGTLPPHQSVDFMLEFAPREVQKCAAICFKRGLGMGGGGRVGVSRMSDFPASSLCFFYSEILHNVTKKFLFLPVPATSVPGLR